MLPVLCLALALDVQEEEMRLLSDMSSRTDLALADLGLRSVDLDASQDAALLATHARQATEDEAELSTSGSAFQSWWTEYMNSHLRQAQQYLQRIGAWHGVNTSQAPVMLGQMGVAMPASEFLQSHDGPIDEGHFEEDARQLAADAEQLVEIERLDVMQESNAAPGQVFKMMQTEKGAAGSQLFGPAFIQWMNAMTSRIRTLLNNIPPPAPATSVPQDYSCRTNQDCITLDRRNVGSCAAAPGTPDHAPDCATLPKRNGVAPLPSASLNCCRRGPHGIAVGRSDSARGFGPSYCDTTRMAGVCSRSCPMPHLLREGQGTWEQGYINADRADPNAYIAHPAIHGRPARTVKMGCSTYVNVDCDGDGVLDHACVSTQGSSATGTWDGTGPIGLGFWLVLSSEGCPNDWGVATRHPNWCRAAGGLWALKADQGRASANANQDSELVR